MKHTGGTKEPNFLKEAFADDQATEAAEVLQLAHSPLSVPERSALKAELLALVSQEPQRYAPFFSRLSQLFHLDEAAVTQVMTGIEWKKAPLPGISSQDVQAELERPGVDAGLVRFEPGVHYPRHRHQALEQNLILSGGYTDETGRHFQAGDLHEMEAGTEHEFWVDKDQPCILATVSDSQIVWTSPLLKFLTFVARLFKSSRSTAS